MKTEHKNISYLILLVSTCLSPLLAQLPELLKTKPYIENEGFMSSVPIKTEGNKIFLQAQANGSSYQFILDTGSPTILTRKVANDLGLKIEGANKGQDANGKLVTMDLAILDRLTIGQVRFRNIPVFIFDTDHLPAGKCMFDGGVIGSEIMPLLCWQIDFQKKALTLTDDSGRLHHIKQAQKSKLKVGGYPFHPIVEYKINHEFTDNAMFDTGSSELLHLNQLALAELKKQKIIKRDVTQGFGSFGVSAGGLGQDSTFHLVSLDKLSIGELLFEDIEVWSRTVPPTLIGSKVFETHVVTLDYGKETVYFSKYKDQEQPHESFGFRPYLSQNSVVVAFIEEPSRAVQAGIKLHDQILSMNQEDLVYITETQYCEVFEMLRALEQLDRVDLTIKRGDDIWSTSLQKN